MTFPSCVLFGDSFVKQNLVPDLNLRCDFKLRGFSGYNTCLLRDIVHHFESDIGIIFAGSNDASTGTQHCPLDLFLQNLSFIFKKFKTCVYVSPGPVNFVHRDPEQHKLYSNKATELAKNYGHVIDCFEILDFSCLEDGLHLNEKGSKIIQKKLFDILDSILPKRKPPHWSTLLPYTTSESVLQFIHDCTN